MEIIFLALAGIYLFLAIKDLPKALMLLLFLLPTYLFRSNFFGIPVTFLEVMILEVFLVWSVENLPNIKARLLKKTENKIIKTKNRYPFDIEIAVLLVIALMAIFRADFSSVSLGIFKAYFLEPIFLFIVIFNVFGSKSDCKKIIWPLALSSLMISLIGLYQWFFDIVFNNPVWGLANIKRIVSLYDYPNAIGLYLAPITILIIGLLITYVKDKKYFLSSILALVAFLNLLAIYLAKSEGAIIGMAVALFLGTFIFKKTRIAAIAVAFVFSLFAFAYKPLGELIVEKATLSDLSGEIRKQQWRETAQMLKINNNWLWGAGISGYQQAVSQYHQAGIFFNVEKDPDFKRKIVIFDDKYKKDHWQPVEIYMYPHNYFLNFWSELGLAGMLLFIWLTAKYLTVAFKQVKVSSAQQKYLAISFFGAMVAIVAHGMVDVPYFKNDLAVVFWLLLALLGMMEVDNRIKSK